MDVFRFEDLDAFFAAAVADFEQQRSWSFGRWAQQLGVAQTASLTRVINGQRAPGESLIARFVAFFSFDAKQAEYFRQLVALQKTKNVAHATAIRARMRELRANAEEPTAALHIQKGRLLELVFNAEPLLVERALGVECAREKGFATLTLQLGQYETTSFGAGNELVLSVAVKPGLPYAFDVTGSAPSFGSYHRLLWGNPWRLGEITIDHTRTRLTATVNVDGREHAYLAMRWKDTRLIEETRDAHGYCRSGAKMERFRTKRRVAGLAVVPSSLTLRLAQHGALFDPKALRTAVVWEALDIEAFAP